MTPDSRLARARRVATSFSWAAVDQALFSLSNMVVVVAIARSGGAESLGRFSVGFAAYLVVLGLSRALVSEPLLAGARQDDRDGVRASVTLTLICAAAGACVIGIVGFQLARPELVVVALALPVTLLQDLLRYLAFQRRRPRDAALLDGGWLLGSVIAWPFITASGSPTAATVYWALGAVVGLAFGWRSSGALRPSGVRVAGIWWRDNSRSFATPLALDSMLGLVMAQGAVFVLAAMSTDQEVGVLRAAQTYFSPVLLMFLAFGLVVIPYLAQRPGAAPGGAALRLAVVSGGVGLLVCAIAFLAVPVLAPLLFGPSLHLTGQILVPVGLRVVIGCLLSSLVAVSKARRRGRDLLACSLSSSVVGVALLVWLTAEFGASGAAWALVGQGIVYATHLGVLVRRANMRTMSTAPSAAE